MSGYIDFSPRHLKTIHGPTCFHTCRTELLVSGRKLQTMTLDLPLEHYVQGFIVNLAITKCIIWFDFSK